MQIYLARNNVQAGPYTLQQLNAMLQSQEVALNDLMWHEGIGDWTRIGDITHNQLSYSPSGHAPQEQPSTKLTVDELYGRKNTQNNVDNNADNSIEEREQSLKSSTAKTKNSTFGTSNTLDLQHTIAPIGSRMIAVALDQIIFFMCFMPFILNTDKEVMAALQTQNMAEIQKHLEGLPQSVIMSFMMLFVLTAVVQIFFLVKRGQTLGKIVTGIRVLDVRSNALPTVTNILLLRTIVTNILYNLPVIGYMILMTDVIIMMTDKEKRSLHDKMASTYVVKATAEQINKKT